MGVWEYFVKVFFASLKSPITYTAAFLAFIPVIREILVRFRPQWEDVMKTYLFITIPLSMLVSLFIISLLVSGYNMYKQIKLTQDQTIKELTNELKEAKRVAIPSYQQIMLQPYFKDTDIPITEMSMISSMPILRNKTFERCNIIGPAIFSIKQNVTVNRCIFDGNPDTILIVTTNRQVSGVVELENATFIECHFTKVAFIGTQEIINLLKKGFIN